MRSDTEVDEGRFRSDLFYRLNVVRIDIPPLRERGHDILTLGVYFLRSSAARSGKGEILLAPQTAEKLLAYDWPGNVRELENCMERAVVLARFDHIVIDDLPERVRAYSDERFAMTAEAEEDLISLDVLEQRYIMRALKVLGGNNARAAQLLGMDRRTLYRKLESYTTAEKYAKDAAKKGEQPRCLLDVTSFPHYPRSPRLGSSPRFSASMNAFDRT